MLGLTYIYKYACAPFLCHCIDCIFKTTMSPLQKWLQHVRAEHQKLNADQVFSPAPADLASEIASLVQCSVLPVSLDEEAQVSFAFLGHELW